MAKAQRKSTKEVRKPKKEGPPKKNASAPTQKGFAVAEAIKRV
ncbi:MAG: hypothetical protein ABIQ66_08295 [Novosphingobium sp.]